MYNLTLCTCDGNYNGPAFGVRPTPLDRPVREADANLSSVNNTAYAGYGMIMRHYRLNIYGVANDQAYLVQDPTQPTWRIVARNYDRYGHGVMKAGATTGLTSGFIIGTCKDVEYGVPQLGHTLTCQTQTSYVSDHGDSGGPVFAVISYAESTIDLRGIHFGHEFDSTVRLYSPVSQIEADFGRMYVSPWIYSGGGSGDDPVCDDNAKIC
jgi:hypothetical protein